jgi:hypothetical protein
MRIVVSGVAAVLILLGGCASRTEPSRAASSSLPVAGSAAVSPPPLSPSVVSSSAAPNEVPISTPASVVVGQPCQASQLTADLEDIEQSGDSDWGWLILRDISPTACQLTGTIGIVGLNAEGVEDTSHATASVAGGLLLSPHAAPVPESALSPASEHVAYLVPVSSESTTIGPQAGADCRGVDEVVPTTLLLDIDGTGAISTSNGDPNSTGALSHLQVCQGQLGAVGPITAEPN